MKKITAALALALLAGTAFGQNLVAPGPGRGPMLGVDWKIGTVVTTEYKKVTGQLVLGQKLDPVLKADGVEYLLMIPRRANALVDAKNGDTITVEGTATTVKSDTKVQPVFHAFKITINGKEIDLTQAQGLGRGMMGWDDRGQGYGQGGMMNRGYGRRN
jgi:hypothetical protein